jgi:hypothetical protein
VDAGIPLGVVSKMLRPSKVGIIVDLYRYLSRETATAAADTGVAVLDAAPAELAAERAVDASDPFETAATAATTCRARPRSKAELKWPRQPRVVSPDTLELLNHDRCLTVRRRPGRHLLRLLELALVSDTTRWSISPVARSSSRSGSRARRCTSAPAGARAPPTAAAAAG